MPFHSQASLDVLCEAGLWATYVTLHTGAVPDETNGFDAHRAPGYTPQALTIEAVEDGLQSSAPITFGPAAREWPQAHSIALRWGAPGLATSIIAHATLPHADRHIIPTGESYTMPAGFLRATLPTGEGWHATPATFLMALRTRLTSANRLRDHVLGADMDPGGTHADDWLREDYRVNGPAGDQLNAVGLHLALYSHNPLDDLTSPLRVCHSDTNPDIAQGWPRDGDVPFYWSPLYHGLTSYHPVQTTGAASPGRITHWLASLGPPTEQSLLYTGELEPIDLAASAGVGFARRSFRLPMVL